MTLDELNLPPEVESALQAALNAHCICGQSINDMSADEYEKGPLADAHKADEAARLAIAKAIRDATRSIPLEKP